ncbi:hypothetical protein HZF02_32825 (plasmid) [Pseudomonas yamanorum]|nr:hypothetical protein HZF02_32825 [Pseudomonas yamanorum]
MTLFFGREDFERSCRHAGISDLAYNADAGEYQNTHTQKAYLVWESLAQTKHASNAPKAWLTRRRGKDQGIAVTRPYATTTPTEWARRDAMGWEQPLALWPAMPITSPSENAVLVERQRQKSVKGYSAELDLRYGNDELLRAAAAYALQWLAPSQARAIWPWPDVPMKSVSRLRAIEKAGALLLAEHERETTMLAKVGGEA